MKFSLPGQFTMRGTVDRMEAWSMRALPYEPKGSALQYRSYLRILLDGLRRTEPSQILKCTYSAAPRARTVDLDNVLSYNVGGAVTRLVGGGVRFERGYSVPPAPLGQIFPHYVRYEFGSSSDRLEMWESAGTLGAFTADIGTAAPKSVASVWAAVRRGSRPPIQAAGAHQLFGIELNLTAGKAISLGQYTKPLLDGSISAFHVHDGSGLTELSSRLGSDAVAMLMDGNWDALGRRPVVRPYREYVAWNPGDHHMVLADISIRYETDRPRLSLDGRIFRVVPARCPAG